MRRQYAHRAPIGALCEGSSMRLYRAICVPLDDQEKIKCTLSSHRVTRELYAKVLSHRAPVGALCEGSLRTEFRSELYAKVVCEKSSDRSSLRRELYVALQSRYTAFGLFDR